MNHSDDKHSKLSERSRSVSDHSALARRESVLTPAKAVPASVDTPTLADLQAIIDAQQAELFQLNYILDNIPGSVYWKDRDGRYLGRNAYAAQRLIDLGVETYGLQRPIYGTTDEDIFDAKTAALFRRHDLEVMHSQREHIYEESETLPNGTLISLYSTKKPLLNQAGDVIGVIGNTVDITHLKKIEKELKKAKETAEAANLVKIEFIRNMEHDIRTPLSGIWGLANYLSQIESDQEKLTLLLDVTESAKELLDYCNGILDFSRIEMGVFPVAEKSFCLKRLFESIYTIEVPAAKQKNLALKMEIDPRLPDSILADQYRIGRILINLVSNAIKFTHKGEIVLGVRKITTNEQEAQIEMYVKDTGIGIPHDKQAYIYEKFTRLFPYTNKAYKGTGLGLVVVKRFVNELGGEIVIDSQLNQGSTFTCRLPFKLPTEGAGHD